jgi:hypothetical protein
MRDEFFAKDNVVTEQHRWLERDVQGGGEIQDHLGGAIAKADGGAGANPSPAARQRLGERRRMVSGFLAKVTVTMWDCLRAR